MEKCLQWLLSKGAEGLGNFNIKQSEFCVGVGCYANRDFLVGDLLFSVPQTCIFSIGNMHDTNLTKLLRHYGSVVGDNDLITSELLIWLHMCEARNNAQSGYYDYFQSLDAKSPSIMSWSMDEIHALQGTNLGKTLLSTIARMNAHAVLLESIRSYVLSSLTELMASQICDSDFLTNISTTFPYTKDDLLWSMGHYLSRRYPAYFSGTGGGGGGDSADWTRTCREVDMGNLGSLVPFLDILNHNADQEWLTFQMKEGSLHVLCNYPIQKVHTPPPYPPDLTIDEI